MEVNKELKIIPPEGMEYYIEDDTVKFRPIEKKLTYDDIAKELFKDKNAWRLENLKVVKYDIIHSWDYITNNTSKRQAEKIVAITQLMNVAKYLNGDWKPNWEDCNNEVKYYIYLYHKNINISYTTNYNNSFVHFKTKEFAQQAIDILGEETIKLALCTDW